MQLPFDLSELTESVAALLLKREQDQEHSAKLQVAQAEHERIAREQNELAERARLRREQIAVARQRVATLLEEDQRLHAYLEARLSNSGQHPHGCFCDKCAFAAAQRINTILNQELPCLQALAREDAN